MRGRDGVVRAEETENHPRVQAQGIEVGVIADPRDGRHYHAQCLAVTLGGHDRHTGQTILGLEMCSPSSHGSTPYTGLTMRPLSDSSPGSGRDTSPRNRLTTTLILGIGSWLFDVPVRGSIMELYAATLVFIAAALAMGLFISTLATTQFQAMQLTFFFFLPFILLSGFMFPFEGMPRAA